MTTDRLGPPGWGLSRAVLVGTWDYRYLKLVPAARHSLDRMRALLTSELCGWPAERVSVVANRAKPGDLHDMLIEVFSDTERDGVALFYYVGHGQPDNHDKLCLSLVDSRNEHARRASTSLRFDDVRSALIDCPAETKIVVLDCCFAGLAARPEQSLSGNAVLDMVRGTGAYTMAASGEFMPAWFETDPTVERPQTFFTQYLADVVENGLTGHPPELTLDQVFAETSERLQQDRKPVPTSTLRHKTGRFVFARNAAPPEQLIDHAAEIEQLRKELAAARIEAERSRARELEAEHLLRQLRKSGQPVSRANLDEAARKAAAAEEAEAQQAQVDEALRKAQAALEAKPLGKSQRKEVASYQTVIWRPPGTSARKRSRTRIGLPKAAAMLGCAGITAWFILLSATPPRTASNREQASWCRADDVVVSGEYGHKPQMAVPQHCEVPDQLLVKDLTHGPDPAVKAEVGDSIRVHIEYGTWATRTIMGSTFDSGKPLTMTNLGRYTTSFKGLEDGLIGAEQGARRLLVVPPNLAADLIQMPGVTFVMVVDVVEIIKRA